MQKSLRDVSFTHRKDIYILTVIKKFIHRPYFLFQRTSNLFRMIVNGHVYARGIYLKKANHYDNFDCYTVGNAKAVVGTSEIVAEPDYDVVKMAANLNFNTNLLCFIIFIKVSRFQIFRYQNV